MSAAWLSGMLAAGPASEHVVPAVSADVKYIPAGKLGGVTFDGNTVYVNDQGQSQGGDFTSSGTVWHWDVTTPFNAANFKGSGIQTTYPGNGAGAMVRPRLVTKDHAADSGSEPDTTASIAYESQDIWVRQTSDGQVPGNDLSQNVDGGMPCYVYVRIRNAGITPSSVSDHLKLYWAKASSGLGWPAPWDGSKNVPLPKLGEPIGTASTGVVLPGQTTMIEFPWTAPNPLDYSALFGADDSHFCLLSRTESSSVAPFGMSMPEGAGLWANVLNNHRIAWRNIHIVNVAPHIRPWAGYQGILVANYTPHRMNAALTFELLDDHGHRTPLSGHRIYLKATGQALDQLSRATMSPDVTRAIGKGEFELLSLERGIEHIRLEPGEFLPLAVLYMPATNVRGAVLRIRQFAREAHGLQLVGGQTFVYGQVKEFRVQLAAPKASAN